MFLIRIYLSIIITRSDTKLVKIVKQIWRLYTNFTYKTLSKHKYTSEIQLKRHISRFANLYEFSTILKNSLHRIFDSSSHIKHIRFYMMRPQQNFSSFFCSWSFRSDVVFWRFSLITKYRIERKREWVWCGRVASIIKSFSFGSITLNLINIQCCGCHTNFEICVSPWEVVF